jgi:hypothetical protein
VLIGKPLVAEAIINQIAIEINIAKTMFRVRILPPTRSEPTFSETPPPMKIAPVKFVIAPIITALLTENTLPPTAGLNVSSFPPIEKAARNAMKSNTARRRGSNFIGPPSTNIL